MAKNDEGGVWRTVGGRRIFIKDGQDLASAMKESGKFEKKETKKEQFGNSELDDKITEQDEKILDYYVMNAGAYDINYVLRNEGVTPTENDKRAINALTKTIDKSTLNKDVEVYRYISNENVFYGLKEGDIYEDKGFMSTTYSNTTDRENNFQDYKIKAIIQAKKGDSALDVSSIYDKQTDNLESEIIFNKNTKLELKKIENVRDKYDEFTRKVYYFETKNDNKNGNIKNKANNNFSSMSRPQLAKLLVENQIKRGIIRPENKQRQIQARLTGSIKMSKDALVEYAEKYL